jgi:hypothetical protein
MRWKAIIHRIYGVAVVSSVLILSVLVAGCKVKKFFVPF